MPKQRRELLPCFVVWLAKPEPSEGKWWPRAAEASTAISFTLFYLRSSRASQKVMEGKELEMPVLSEMTPAVQRGA